MAARAHASYACDPAHSRGRLFAESESRTRTVYQRDRDRVIHASAFRRLKHKTQVFVSHEGDHYRTRLTHSLEVAQIARSISRHMGLDEDLTEALALAHDLGHTPFGHAGEGALDEAMADYGGFDHNAQTLRILTKLERRYADFDGLNLTWETLEGVVKHNGPLLAPSGEPRANRPIPAAIAEYATGHDLELHTFPSGEAQVAALSDDIAYGAHDVEDGLRARLFAIVDLEEIGLLAPIVGELRERYPGLETARFVAETTRRMIDRLVGDVIAESTARLEAAAPRSPADIRAQAGPLIGFSDTMAARAGELRSFLYARMYNHDKQKHAHRKARRIVAELFALFLEHPDRLPKEWRQRREASDDMRGARLVADYIAGMTDRYAIDEHARLFSGSKV
ncbi:MAG: deoxyguanosinetriphosphate triphosphohydrolase [Alphaproteobacteria bacterium]|nr:deoxyguanosinetriphosphate triphosphohydrolase [Alphaproteobacteria bacterium]